MRLALVLLAGLAAASDPGADAAPGEAEGRAAPDATALYESAQFDAAASAYRKLAAADPGNAALQYNLGNAYFRSGAPGSLGRAVAAYSRAFALDPRDGDIRHNLDFALRRAGEELYPAGVPTGLFLLYHALSHAELAALFWLGWWLALLAGSAALVWPRARPRLAPVAAAAAALCLLAGAWWGLRRGSGGREAGVILAPSAEARSGPGENFPVSFKAPGGRRVEVLGSRGAWLEIGVFKEGLKGWLPAEQVERI